jgi:hypothetical protein
VHARSFPRLKMFQIFIVLLNLSLYEAGVDHYLPHTDEASVTRMLALNVRCDSYSSICRGGYCCLLKLGDLCPDSGHVLLQPRFLCVVAQIVVHAPQFPLLLSRHWE